MQPQTNNEGAPTLMSSRPISARTLNKLTTHVAAATNSDEPEYEARIRALIASYPADLITELAEKQTNDELPYVISLIISDGGDSDLVKEALCFMPYLPSMPEFRSLIFVKSLHHYPQLPNVSDYTADETTRKQCQALLTVTNAAYSRLKIRAYKDIFKRGYAGTDDRISIETIGNDAGLVTLLMQKPDQAPQIAEIVVERITADAALIRSILDHQTPALAEGTL